MKKRTIKTLTKKNIASMQTANQAVEAVITDAPWSMTVEGSRTDTPVIKVYSEEWENKNIDGSPVCFGEIDYRAFCICRRAIICFLAWQDVKTGEPLLINDLIDHCLHYGGTLPLCGEAGTKLALFAHLAHGIDNPYRLELLARRIGRMDHAAADTYLDEIVHPVCDKNSAVWTRTGLTLMFAGPEDDPKAVMTALEARRELDDLDDLDGNG